MMFQRRVQNKCNVPTTGVGVFKTEMRTLFADSSPTSTDLNGSSMASFGGKQGGSTSLPNGTTISHRDVSVSSGLADSESSPLSPGAPTPLALRRSGSDRKQELSKNRSRVAPVNGCHHWYYFNMIIVIDVIINFIIITIISRKDSRSSSCLDWRFWISALQNLFRDLRITEVSC